jgi:phosphoribosyl-ATP pyrophosphohydrolase/phosphoribosyl-AMP cyclohydrolase
MEVMGDIAVKFDKNGLIPVIVQDHLTGEIRMFAHATIEALRATLSSGRATFWSRSRNELWEKGRTSGNTLKVHRVLVDCDDDCLIYSVEPLGATCHTGAPSCFFQTMEAEGETQQRAQPQTMLARLEAEMEARRGSTAAKSYTKSLLEGGADKIGAKVREEADEFARAIAQEEDERVTNEAADVVYHLIVGLKSRNLDWRDVLTVLEQRATAKLSGHEEKAARLAQALSERVGRGTIQ